MKTVYIIHGWGGSPNEPMHTWLKNELVSKSYNVVVPVMPNAEKPEINSWVSKLKGIVENPDRDTIFVGHSIGCQTILRYLETLNPAIVVGGVVLIAPWLTLQNLESEEEWNIAKPWLETDIGFAGIAKHVPKITAIFSGNDPVVPFENTGLFEKKFGTENIIAENIIESNKGHFTEKDGVSELPSALNAVLEIK